ncbi:hypothetical protein BSNK01_28220 [Bacillaceae bacterium]
MRIRDWHYKHGAALAIIINEREYQSITKLENHSQSEYLLNNDTGLYCENAHYHGQNREIFFKFQRQAFLTLSKTIC